MAVIGCLGDVIFRVSDQTVETLDNWKWSGSARYSTHARHNNHALTEFTGLEPDKITFEVELHVELGVDPMKEAVQIWNYERNGVAVPLTVGSKGYGKYRWNVVSHDLTIKSTDSKGNVTGALLSITLQEYLRGRETLPLVVNYKRQW